MEREDRCTLHVPINGRKTGADAEGERTETGVMAHNVTVDVITSQKLLQALPRHGRLKSKRTGKWAFSAEFDVHP